jgi:hypothetical protein
MVSSVLLTANHYVIDAAVGAALVLASMAAARHIERRKAAPEPVPEPAVAGIPRQRDRGSVTGESASSPRRASSGG